MRCVILYSSDNDPVVEVAQARGLDVEVMHVDQVLQFLEQEAWPTMFDLRLDDPRLSGLADATCINRVQDLSGTALVREVSSRSCAELWAYNIVGNFIGCFAGATCDTGPRGVSRALLPLNSQWWYFDRDQQLEGMVSTPRFVYPFGAAKPDITGFGRPLHTSVWNVFNWRDEGEQITGIDRFVIDRPAGSPYVCYYFGSDVECFALDADADAIDLEVVGRVAQRCRDVFGSEAGEFLLFSEGGNTVFAGFSPKMETSAAHDRFGDHCAEWIESLLHGGYPARQGLPSELEGVCD